MGEIILDHGELARRIEQLKAAGKRVVFTNGGFDLLHVGHLRTLAGARALGDALVVALNSDASIRRNKGPTLPIIPAAERAELVAALACVDLVTVFDEPRVDGLLLRLKPHVHAKGTDYTVETVPERATVLGYGGEIAITGDAKAHSTSWIIARIREGSVSMPSEPRRPPSSLPDVLADTELRPESVDVSDADKLRHLSKLIQRIINETDKGEDQEARRKKLWIFWFFMYLIWWESKGLKAREQDGGGPARGIIQMEPQTLWDVIKRYLLTDKITGAVANLAKAAGVTEEEMLRALKAFIDKNAVPSPSGDTKGKNTWPDDGGDATLVETWLKTNDTFAIKLLRYFFRWHGDKGVPPGPGGDTSADPRSDSAKKLHAKHWGEDYNRGAEGKAKQGDFVKKANALDKALKE